MALSSLNFSELCPGDALPEVVRRLSQEKINLYAEAVGDFNPIHVDESFAARTAFGGTIAHGMLILAYVSEMMAIAFGESWFSGGRLAVRFKAPARSTDTITAAGKVNSVITEKDGLTFSCNVSCSNQNRETMISGEAWVKIPLNRNGGLRGDAIK